MQEFYLGPSQSKFYKQEWKLMTIIFIVVRLACGNQYFMIVTSVKNHYSALFCRQNFEIDSAAWVQYVETNLILEIYK